MERIIMVQQIPRVNINLHPDISHDELELLKELKEDVWTFIQGLTQFSHDYHEGLLKSLGEFFGRIVHRYHVSENPKETLELAQRLCLQAFASISEILVRFESDYLDLEQALGRIGQIKGLEFPDSDFHNGGQFVLILDCEYQKILYKPRSLAIDNWWAKFVDLLGAHEYIVTARSLAKEGYGWQEYLADQECASIQEVESAYYSYGVLLALLTFLGGNDMYFTNLKVLGGRVAVLDLETVMSYPSDTPVLQTGLLAVQTPWFSQSQALQKVWEEGNTHFPIMEGRSFPFTSEFEDKFFLGLREGISLLHKYSEPLKELIEGMANLRVRYVLKATARYALEYKAVMLVNLSHRVGAYAKISRSYFQELDNVHASELEQILQGDIPYYWFFPDRKTLFSQSGEFPSFFGYPETLQEILLYRLQNLETVFHRAEELVYEALYPRWYLRMLWRLPKPVIRFMADVVRSGVEP